MTRLVQTLGDSARVFAFSVLSPALLIPTLRRRLLLPPGERRQRLPRLPAVENELVVLLDSILLRTWNSILTRGPEEEILIVTGARSAARSFPCLVLRPEYERQSVVGVAAAQDSSHSILCYLQDSGHHAQLFIHSHPGYGPRAVSESSIDVANQERFERAGYAAITGITSRDGYWHFFSNSIPFRLEVYGHGVSVLGPTLLRLDSRSAGAGLPQSSAEDCVRALCVGSPGSPSKLESGTDRGSKGAARRRRWNR